MTKQKHIKAVDAASNAEDLLPLEQMMSQGSASNEGAAHAVDDINQVNDSAHQGAEDESAALVSKLRFADFAVNSQQSYEPLARVLRQSFSGGTPASNIDAYWNGDIHWASTKDLTSNVLTTTADFITELGLRNSSSKLAKAGSILVGMHIGVGKVAIANIDVAINQDLRALVPDLSRVDLWFLLYVLEANAIRLESYGRGSTVKGITQEDLLQLPVPLLPLPEQQRIGALFKELDHNIELNRGLLEKLTQLKKSMLEQMFPREGESLPRLRFAGFTEPWKTDSFEQVFSFLPKVNIAREQLSVSSGCVKNIHYGDILTVFGDVLDVNLEAVPRIVGSSLLPKHDPFLLQNGDVVIADTAEDSSAGKVIELTGVSDGVQVIGGQHTMPCRPCVKFSPYFLGYLLNSSCFRDALVNQLQGIKVLSISKANLSVLSVKFPDSLAEQQRIGEFFKALDQRIAQQRAKLEKLGQLKKALLEQMFV